MTSLITGLIVAIITFPGVIFRQVAIQLFCCYFQIPVFKVVYFQAWPPGGTVLHEVPDSPWIRLMLIFGPAAANTVLGFLIGAPAVLGLLISDNTIISSLLDLFLIWLGTSIAVHTFPTLNEAETVTNAMTAAQNPVWVQMMGLPLSAVTYMAAIGKILWLDAIYALVVVIVIPILFFEVLRMTF